MNTEQNLSAPFAPTDVKSPSAILAHMEMEVEPPSAFEGISAHAADPEKIAVTAGLPYPPLSVSGPSEEYARLLMQATGGPQSELTAICQYLYDNWRTDPLFPRVADTLKRIAEVEMHHLDMLGRLIVMLGGDPRCESFDGQTPVPWSGGDLNYSTDINQILRYNIYLEEQAVKGYRALAEQIHDTGVSAVLLRIALDEQVHVKVLKSFFQRGR